MSPFTDWPQTNFLLLSYCGCSIVLCGQARQGPVAGPSLAAVLLPWVLQESCGLPASQGDFQAVKSAAHQVHVTDAGMFPVEVWVTKALRWGNRRVEDSVVALPSMPWPPSPEDPRGSS